ncbi:hypothetical protein [Piscirickettsia litoralis]|uniref:Uncharacterized protein n=1 Tax=Piscirickettsia litoralis TaxID=1891921 RepID=A0ABX3A0A8_9GAMM|nr:hypothetical protein [Piscirickettsia litoralis]ODN41136.1 hypothetical protein BGC07_17840 [Piscirickettsia litoralis]
MVKSILISWIDKAASTILGEEFSKNQTVKLISLVTSSKGYEVKFTESFSRTVMVEDYESFISNEANKLEEYEKLQLGQTVGHSVAKNLHVSFDNIELKKMENINEN